MMRMVQDTQDNEIASHLQMLLPMLQNNKFNGAPPLHGLPGTGMLLKKTSYQSQIGPTRSVSKATRGQAYIVPVLAKLSMELTTKTRLDGCCIADTLPQAPNSALVFTDSSQLVHRIINRQGHGSVGTAALTAQLTEL